MKFSTAALALSLAATSFAQVESESESSIPSETALETSLETASPSSIVSTGSSFITTRSTSRTPTPTADSNVITTSIFFDSGVLGDIALDYYSDLTLSASLVTVEPSGTVIDVGCPFPESTDVCSALTNIGYTIQPGTELAHWELTTSTLGVNMVITADASCEGIPNPTSLACVNTGEVTLRTGGQSTATTTTITTTFTDPTYVPLLITAGLDKTQAIPEPTGAAGVNRAGGALAGVAGAFVAAMVL